MGFQIYFPRAEAYYIEPKRGSCAYRTTTRAVEATQFESIQDAREEMRIMGFHDSTSADSDMNAYVTSVVVDCREEKG